MIHGLLKYPGLDRGKLALSAVLFKTVVKGPKNFSHLNSSLERMQENCLEVPQPLKIIHYLQTFSVVAVVIYRYLKWCYGFFLCSCNHFKT